MTRQPTCTTMQEPISIEPARRTAANGATGLPSLRNAVARPTQSLGRNPKVGEGQRIRGQLEWPQRPTWRSLPFPMEQSKACRAKIRSKKEGTKTYGVAKPHRPLLNCGRLKKLSPRCTSCGLSGKVAPSPNYRVRSQTNPPQCRLGSSMCYQQGPNDGSAMGQKKGLPSEIDPCTTPSRTFDFGTMWIFR